ncbi:MAG: glutamate--tRNA ligase [Candidatus Hydrogenedentota bacterium]
MITTRFAPSPTGFLHLGSARTALLNYLYAKHTEGKFILRIEDTDAKRSDKSLSAKIIEALKWIGLEWDEEYYQSERIDIYKKYAYQLLENGFAYRCFCNPDEIEKKTKNNIIWKYDKNCLKLSQDKIDKLLKDNTNFVIRFNVVNDGNKITFYDNVRGEVSFDKEQVDDFVLLKADNYPTYHLAVCCDDHLMGVTDILRGEDHLTNTPKQILIYNAFNWEPPRFYHLPLIHGSDGKKLSKRHGSVDTLFYKRMGILSETLVNYLTLLGYSPQENKELFDMSELIEKFDIKRIRKSYSRFDLKKLVSINSEKIRNLKNERIYDMLSEYEEFNRLTQGFNKEYILKGIELIKTRMPTLRDFFDRAKYMFIEPESYDEKGLKKYFKENTKDLLLQLKIELEKLDDFKETNIENSLRSLCSRLNIKDAELIHPLRIVLTGYTVSPGIFEVIAHLGKKVVVERIENARIRLSI